MIRLSYDVRKYLRLKSLITFFIILIFYLIIAGLIFFLDFYKEWILLGLLVLTVLHLIIFVIIKPKIYQNVTKYQVFKTRVVTVEGFIIVEHKMLPLLSLIHI